MTNYTKRFNNIEKALSFCNKVNGKFIDCSNQSNSKSKFKVKYKSLTYNQQLEKFAIGFTNRNNF